MIQVTIIARLPLIREGLRALLASEDDLDVTAPVQSGSNLLQQISDDAPDCLLLDVDYLEHEGWGLIREIANLAPEIAILIVAETPGDRRVGRALADGARGYLLRDGSPAEIAAAVRAIHQGFYVLHPSAASQLIGRAFSFAPDNGTIPGDEAEEAALIEPLSSRELEVLRLMARGMPNKEIGARLFITEHTVKFHIRSILGKLGASNRTEAVTLAIQKGLVTL